VLHFVLHFVLCQSRQKCADQARSSGFKLHSTFFGAERQHRRSAHSHTLLAWLCCAFSHSFVLLQLRSHSHSLWGWPTNSTFSAPRDNFFRRVFKLSRESEGPSLTPFGAHPKEGRNTQTLFLLTGRKTFFGARTAQWKGECTHRFSLSPSHSLLREEENFGEPSSTFRRARRREGNGYLSTAWVTTTRG